MMQLFRCCATFLALCTCIAAAASKPKNVLLLIADDLRPQLNKAYGQRFMHTPNLDKFAGESLVFDFAYTNLAICSPSRNSFLSGRVPDKTRVWNFINDFRQGGLSAKGGRQGTDWISLPQFFKNHGYIVLGHGKTYHPGHPPNNDEPYSWSQEQAYVPLTSTRCQNGERFCPGVGEGWTAAGKKEFIEDDENAAHYSDYNTTLSALATLKAYARRPSNNTKPWFIALGLHFPHQPWPTPAWAVEAYGPSLPAPPKHPYAPVHVPPIAFTAELDGEDTLRLNESLRLLAKSAPPGVTSAVEYTCPSPGNNTVPLYVQQQLRLGYYSAVTHTDAMFGKVLSLVDELDVASDTAVVLTGDHGWQLGEHAEWGKHTNFELAVQVPLVIRAPWKGASAGMHTQSFAELVDLYRTLVGLAGLPAADVQDDVDGDDLSPLLDDPTRLLKQEAYAQYARCPGDRFWPTRLPGHPAWFYNNCETVPAANITAMGYTVRTREWRLVEWLQWDGTECVALFDREPLALELYSHRQQRPFPLDFDAWENENVAADPANARAVAQLRATLRRRFDTKASLGCPPDGDLEGRPLQATPELDMYENNLLFL